MVAPKTYSSYQQTVNKQLLPLFAKRELQDINRDDVFLLHKSLSHLSNTSIAYAQKVLSQIMKHAAINNKIPANPIATVKPPRKNPPHTPQYDGKDLRKLLDAVPEPVYTLILLAYTTGLRRGEINALTWNNVDFRNRVIRVVGSTGEFGAGPTKNGKCRTVYMGREIFEQLLNAANQKGLVIDRCKDAFWATKAFRYWADKCGMTGFRLHDLRHLHATELLEQGVHPKIVQERLGHSTINTTLDIYSHATIGLQAKEIEKLDMPEPKIIERTE